MLTFWKNPKFYGVIATALASAVMGATTWADAINAVLTSIIGG